MAKMRKSQRPTRPKNGPRLFATYVPVRPCWGQAVFFWRRPSRTSQARSGPSGRPHVPVQGLELGETPYPQRAYAWLDCQREFGAAVRSTVGQTKVPGAPHLSSRRLPPLPAPATRPHGSCEGRYLGETT